jgi:DNA-binding transcriptional MerR regulator
MTIAGTRADDPLTTLREYRQLAPWNLRDLATVTGAILEASGIRPINAAASPRPNERTIRYYVTRGLVTPPDGRGTAATYTYRHLLQILSIKLRQMEGVTLSQIGHELEEISGDVLERRVAASLGPGLPAPRRLPLTSQDRPAWGRSGRALRAWLVEDEEDGTEERAATGTKWRRLQISRGVELHLDESHPLLQLGERESDIADAVRLAVARILGQQTTASEPASEPDASDRGEPKS